MKVQVIAKSGTLRYLYTVDDFRSGDFQNFTRILMLRVMYGFKKLKFEFPIKRAQIDFWSIGFRRCVRGPTEINPQLPRNIVVAWTIEFEHMFGVF